MTRKPLLFGIAAVAAVALACGDQASTPTAPTPAVSSDTAAAAADGSTLKATAPAPQQPANGSTADSVAPNLVIANATLKHLGDVALAAYDPLQINVETPAGGQVHAAWATPQAGTDLSAHRVPAGVLQPDTTYRWRTRAELGSADRAVVQLLDLHHAEIRGRAGVLPERDRTVGQPHRREDDWRRSSAARSSCPARASSCRRSSRT